MCKDNGNNSVGMVAGFAVGAAIGAGLTFLFGTEEGKKVQKNLKTKYPKLVNKVQKGWDLVSENVSDKYEDVVTEVEKVKDEAQKTISETVSSVLPKSKSKRFVKSGRKL